MRERLHPLVWPLAHQRLEHLVDDVEIRQGGEGVVRVEFHLSDAGPAAQQGDVVEGLLEEGEQVGQVGGGGVDGTGLVAGP
ncbi:hypothetical protein [Nonomuraea helvata]|uniref:Uncharacterized protein n=1 Tax=Nonomuraea helvata TaxID=37484 RepID=A0ABV5SCG0_9ACTN